MLSLASIPFGSTKCCAKNPNSVLWHHLICCSFPISLLLIIVSWTFFFNSQQLHMVQNTKSTKGFQWQVSHSYLLALSLSPQAPQPPASLQVQSHEYARSSNKHTHCQEPHMWWCSSAPYFFLIYLWRVAVNQMKRDENGFCVPTALRLPLTPQGFIRLCNISHLNQPVSVLMTLGRLSGRSWIHAQGEVYLSLRYIYRRSTYVQF